LRAQNDFGTRYFVRTGIERSTTGWTLEDEYATLPKSRQVLSSITKFISCPEMLGMRANFNDSWSGIISTGIVADFYLNENRSIARKTEKRRKVLSPTSTHIRTYILWAS
jgi:hypothetical protein